MWSSVCAVDYPRIFLRVFIVYRLLVGFLYVWFSVSVLTAIFQVNLGQPVFTEAKDGGGGGDNWSYKSCKAPIKSSPPTNRHPVFFTGRMPFLSPNQQCQSTEIKGKNITFHGLAYPKLTWGLPTLSLATGYLGGGLPCLSSALWCQYPRFLYVWLYSAIYSCVLVVLVNLSVLAKWLVIERPLWWHLHEVRRLSP